MSAPRRDDGSALLLVLVLVVVGSLIIIPTLSYSIAVMRANTVLSDKTKRMEAVRGAFRVAMADPRALYEECGLAGPSVARPLGSMSFSGVDVSMACYFIDFASALDSEQLRLGVVATQAGVTLPEGLAGSHHPGVGEHPDSWLAESTLTSTTDRIWKPHLPVHSRSLRSSAPYSLPPEFPPCSVYFPGTYQEPLELDGPTYFASGVYYFESEVVVRDGAQVSVGPAPGACSSDQEAAFYVEPPPSTHDISGQGGTWIFGAQGRLIVRADGTAPIGLRFGQRYVHGDDAGGAPSAGVSITSVNGHVGEDGVAGDLDLAGLLFSPLSLVGGESAVSATDQGLVPSTLTPAPIVPEPPTMLVAEPLAGHVRVSWEPPIELGGSPLEGYQVTVRRAGAPTTVRTCETPPDRTECTVSGLANGVDHDVEVVAVNAQGASAPALYGMLVRPDTHWPAVSAASPPTAVVAEPFDGAVRISWTAGHDGNAPVTGFVVSGVPTGGCEAGYGEMSCIVAPLEPLDAPEVYEFTVTANNRTDDGAAPAVLTSPPSEPSTGVSPVGPPLPVVEPTEPGPFTVHRPPAIVEFDLSGAGAADVVIEIPGYLAVPQGRVVVHNPTGRDVRIEGGILAASIEVDDARFVPGDSAPLPIGFVERIVQRKFIIVTETTAGTPSLTSRAVVQVNQNGGYAVNGWEIR